MRSDFAFSLRSKIECSSPHSFTNRDATTKPFVASVDLTSGNVFPGRAYFSRAQVRRGVAWGGPKWALRRYSRPNFRNFQPKVKSRYGGLIARVVIRSNPSFTRPILKTRKVMWISVFTFGPKSTPPQSDLPPPDHSHTRSINQTK